MLQHIFDNSLRELSMEISDFVILALNDRAQALWDRGKYLETIVYYGQTVKLYALENFFVEVYYSNITKSINKVEVAYGDNMKKYTNRIKLNL
jgi:hypothetical protein